MHRIKEWLIAAFVGAAIALSLVMFFVAQDNTLQVAKKHRDKVADLIKKNQYNDLNFLRKNVDQRKKIVKEDKNFFKKIRVAKEKAKVALLAENQKKKKVDWGNENLKKSDTDVEKIFSLTHQIFLLQDLILAKNDVILEKNNIITQQKKYIFKLNEQKKLLFSQNSMLEFKLKQSHKIQKEALHALNANMRSLYVLTARDKAMKIGLGVGISLAVVGGFLGGFYLKR